MAVVTATAEEAIDRLGECCEGWDQKEVPAVQKTLREQIIAGERATVWGDNMDMLDW